MNKLNFMVIVLLSALMSVLTSCQSDKRPTQTESKAAIPFVTAKPANQLDLYTTFEQNNKFGVKDNKGKVVIPAVYEDILITEKVEICSLNDRRYYFIDGKQIFKEGALFSSVEDDYISAESVGGNMLYFFASGRKIENIAWSRYLDGAMMCYNKDDTYSFYNLKGEEKANGLKNPICLMRLEEGYVGEEFLVFTKDNGKNMLLFKENGDLKCTIPLTIWQNVAIDILKRYQDEDNFFEMTFSYTADLDATLRKYFERARRPYTSIYD